jgi:transglutaminase/protease-like cytokinesis protein 3
MTSRMSPFGTVNLISNVSSFFSFLEVDKICAFSAVRTTTKKPTAVSTSTSSSASTSPSANSTSESARVSRKNVARRTSKASQDCQIAHHQRLIFVVANQTSFTTLVTNEEAADCLSRRFRDGGTEWDLPSADLLRVAD